VEEAEKKKDTLRWRRKVERVSPIHENRRVLSEDASGYNCILTQEKRWRSRRV
jgi:hypothetical protein